MHVKQKRPAGCPRTAAGQPGRPGVSITAAAKQAQQHDKEVDEVQIQRQRADNRALPDCGRPLLHDALLAHGLDLLRIIEF